MSEFLPEVQRRRIRQLGLGGALADYAAYLGGAPAGGPRSYGSTTIYAPDTRAAPPPGTTRGHAGAPTAPPSPFPGFLTPEQQMAQAQAYVNAGLLPQQQELWRQQQQAAQQTASRGATMSAAAQGLVEALKGIAPQIQQDYAQAAEQTSAFSKGYSDAMRALEAQEAQRVNEMLARTGASPEEGVKTTGAADVLYGITGSLPAQTLAREGAAFTAAARNLPATALGRGYQDVVSNEFAGAAEQDKLAAALADIGARAPGLLETYLNQLAGQQSQLRSEALSRGESRRQFDEQMGFNREQAGLKRSADITDAQAKAAKQRIDTAFKRATTLSKSGYIYDVDANGRVYQVKDSAGKPVLTSSAQAQQVLADQRERQIQMTNQALGLKAQDQQFEQQTTQQKLALERARVNQAGQRIATDERRLQQQAERQGDLDAYRHAQDTATALTKSGTVYTVARTKAGYQVVPALDAQGRPLRVGAKKGAKPNFTATKIKEFTGTATNIVRVAREGGTDQNGDPIRHKDGSVVTEANPLTFQEAMDELEAEGMFAYPKTAAIAFQALNKLYPPGQFGRGLAPRDFLGKPWVRILLDTEGNLRVYQNNAEVGVLDPYSPGFSQALKVAKNAGAPPGPAGPTVG